jgi:hypothetical protein
MMYIMKNVSFGDGTHEYIVYNDETKKQSRFTDSAKIAEQVASRFNLKTVSPAEMVFKGLNRYQHVQLENIMK